LGHSVLEQNDLFTVGQPRIEALSRETGESVYITVLDGLDVVVSAKAKKSYGFHKDEQIGFRYPSYNGASGRAILAHLPYEERRHLFKGHRMRPSAPHSPTTYRQLEKILQETHERGIAIAHEEYEPGYSSVAAPIFDFSGRVCAAVTITGSTARFKARIDELIPMVQRTAAQISNDLGCPN
jgi:DNA-binding IclR family transcriptional regulator